MQMEAQQQCAAAEKAALEKRLAEADTEAQQLRSQADHQGNSVQAKDMV